MKKPKVVAIIQARMGSSRLPAKVLMDLAGKPVLQHVVARAVAIKGVDEVVVAIPDSPANAPLKRLITSLDGVSLFEGSENDVLDRFYRAARAHKADVVVRITADCPLLDSEVSGRVVAGLLASRADYCSNVSPPTFPDGLDTEAFRFGALAEAWKRARSKVEREHVTVFIRNHSDRFRQVNVSNSRDLSHLRWTLDEPADLEFLKRVFDRLNGKTRSRRFQDVVSLLEREPELGMINSRIHPNEGYYLSFLREPLLRAKRLRLIRSSELLERAKHLVPGCSQTFSKAPFQFVRGVAPLFLKKGKGCRVWDVDGNGFLDTSMALAPVSLGYCDPDVDAAIADQLKEGTILSQPHPLEIEVAGLLNEGIPCAEMVRFAKNGSDVTSAAVRLARYVTSRDIVLAGGYHGWHDWFIGTTTRNGGVPRAVAGLTRAFPYNDIPALERLLRASKGRVAAVILEPIGVEEPAPGYLEAVAKLARGNGALLIFDEVVTGFRLALGGAQQHFGVTPDLACFGKAMANGMPLSAVVGRASLMRRFEEIFFSGTFGGELLSLAACRATILKMRRRHAISHFWQQGRRLLDGFNALARALGTERFMSCVGLPPHTVVTFKDDAGEPWWELKSLFQQECVRRGLLFTGAHNPSLALGSGEVDEVLRVYASAMRVTQASLREGRVRARLDGPPVEPIFRKA